MGKRKTQSRVYARTQETMSRSKSANSREISNCRKIQIILKNHAEMLGFAMVAFVTVIVLASAMWSVACLIMCCCCELEAANASWKALRAAKSEISDSLLGMIVVGLLFFYAALWMRAYNRRFVSVRPAYLRSTGNKHH